MGNETNISPGAPRTNSQRKHRITKSVEIFQRKLRCNPRVAKTMPRLAQRSTMGMVEDPSRLGVVSRISVSVDLGAAVKGFQIRTCNEPVSAYARTNRKPTQPAARA